MTDFMISSHQRGYPIFSDLFAQHNEHRIFFPRLVFFYLAELTHWNIRAQLFFNLGVMAAASVMLLGLVRRRCSSMRFALFVGVLANVALFSPSQWENFIFSFQLQILLPTFALLGALLVLDRGPFSWWRFGAAGLLAIVSTYSFANGMMIWPLLLPSVLALARPNRRKMVVAGMIWIVLAAACIGLYLHGFQDAVDHPPLIYFFQHPLVAAQFLFAFIGNGMRTTASLWGVLATGEVVVGLAAAAALIVLVKRRRSLSRYWPWLVLMAYTMGNGLLTTYGRIKFGLPGAAASRYGTLALPIYVGLVLIMAIVYRDIWMAVSGKSRSMMCALAGLAILGAGAGVTEAWEYGLGQIKTQSLHRETGRACVQFFCVVPNIDALNARLTFFSMDEMTKKLRALNQAGLLSCGLIPSTDVKEIDGGKQFDCGYFENLRRFGSSIKVSGWARIRRGKCAADAVLLTTPDAAGAERIFAIVDGTRDLRPDVATHLHAPRLSNTGWSATFDVGITRPGEVISAWAYDTYAKKAYRMKGTQTIPRG